MVVLPNCVAETWSRMLRCWSFLQEQGVLSPYPTSGRCWVVKKEKLLCKGRNLFLWRTLSVDWISEPWN